MSTKYTPFLTSYMTKSLGTRLKPICDGIMIPNCKLIATVCYNLHLYLLLHGGLDSSLQWSILHLFSFLQNMCDMNAFSVESFLKQLWLKGQHTFLLVALRISLFMDSSRWPGEALCWQTLLHWPTQHSAEVEPRRYGHWWSASLHETPLNKLLGVA